MIRDWPIVGIARYVLEEHGTSHVWVLDADVTEPRDCGSVFTPVSLGSNFYGYTVVSKQEFTRRLRAQRKACG